MSKQSEWFYKVAADGDDLIITTPIIITAFGGAGDGTCPDRQDNSNTASGVNTKHNVIHGVALAMDSRQFPGMKKSDPSGYLALFGAPFPRMPWNTPVQVTIGGVSKVFGVVDLGPGIGASKPGQPHGLDLTLPAAALFMPNKSLVWLAKNFKVNGTVRVIDGKKFIKP